MNSGNRRGNAFFESAEGVLFTAFSKGLDRLSSGIWMNQQLISPVYVEHNQNHNIPVMA